MNIHSRSPLRFIEFGRQIVQPPVSKIHEVDFRAFPDGSLLELVEDPADPARTLLAYARNGEVTVESQVQVENERFAPRARGNGALKQIVLPNGLESCGTARELLLDMAKFMRRIVPLEDDAYQGPLILVATFVLSTWIIDRLPVAPYLAIVGPPETGKTTLLRVLAMLVRRGLLTGEVSPAALYRTCDQFQPTLLLDEGATPERRKEILHLLRMGNTPGVPVLKNDRPYQVYGAKAVAWNELPDDSALASRSIIIPMKQSNDPSLRLVSDRTTQEEAATLRRRLLDFRLRNFNTVVMPQLDTERLRPRKRELFRSLGAAIADDKDCCQSLLEVLKYTSIFEREPLPLEHQAVLMGLFIKTHEKKFQPCVYVKHITTEVNDELKREGERLRLEPRRIGAILTSMGFVQRRRTKDGCTVLLTEADLKRIHDLIDEHGLDPSPNRPPRIWGDCPMCGDVPFLK